MPLRMTCCCPSHTVSLTPLLQSRGVEKIWKPFVQNRALEIRKLLPPECWVHCSGQDNPASSLHAACQAFSKLTQLTHTVSQYLVSMHAQPATTAHHSKGECHHALRLHSTWPTDLALADTSVASSRNIFYKTLHLLFIEQ